MGSMFRPSRIREGRRTTSWLLATALFAGGLPATRHDQTAAQEPAAAERAATLRAMFLLKVAPYLTRESPVEPPPKVYRMAVVGDDAVTKVAQTVLAGKKVDDRTVEIVAVAVADAAAGKGTADCDLMYVATTVDAEQVKKIVASHADKPVPLVGEHRGFAAGGAAVQLFVQDNLIRFEANVEALKKQGIRGSPQLLKLSRKGPQ